MIIEGLVLDHVMPNIWYTLTCLPLKLQGSEGAPARCLLTKGPEPMNDEGLDTTDDLDAYMDTSGYDSGDNYGSYDSGDNYGSYDSSDDDY